MGYDSACERSWRDLLRFKSGLHQPAAEVLIDPPCMLSRDQLVDAFIKASPSAAKYRQAFINRLEGRLLIVKQRLWQIRLQVARSAIWPRG
jgi:hypothetical protein